MSEARDNVVDLKEKIEPAPATIRPAPPRRRAWRRLPLLLVPLAVLAVGVHLYLGGGRYVSTDNAYVKADIVTITTDVPGFVAALSVTENEAVEAGRELFRLEDETYRIALDGARADLAEARNDIVTMRAAYRQTLAQLDRARSDLVFYQTGFERQRDLIRRGAATQAAYDQAKKDLDAAEKGVLIADRQAEAALARLGGRADDPPETHARYLKARSAVEKAERDLRRTVVVAPMAGVVTQVDTLQVGAYLRAAQPAMSLVSSARVWVEANLKETDLGNVTVGDAARLTLDGYPGRRWEATVASISPASGAEFSVLPPQNASGNWVKVVQRVTVRLELAGGGDAPPLRSGMSAVVEIDTGRQRRLADLWLDLSRLLGL